MTERPTYGAAFADVYDEWYADTDDVPSVIALLSEHAPHRVLELGVGTGRIAIPLVRHLAALRDDTRVTGIDESPEMLARLAANDTAGLVRAVLGDMASEIPEEEFDLVYVSYNTFFNLSGHEQQTRCLANVAARLAPDGRLVLDCCVIDESAPASGTTEIRRGAWSLRTTSMFDAATGVVDGETTSTHDDGRTVCRPFRIAYATPESLDEMCAAAGLALTQRFGGWQKTAFHPDSARHVSVYRNLR
jgi:SAM-dependent methyltransferase